MEYVLDVSNLSVAFKMYQNGLKQKSLRVISNLNVKVKAGEVLAVAGASGSGKSLLAHAIMGILPNNAIVDGAIEFMGKPLTPKLIGELRGKQIALVPQSVEYLDPLIRSGKQVSDDKSVVTKVFERYKLKEFVARLFPFQLSGGMARRILVGTAVASDAQLIIADEPTPGMSEELANRAMGHFRDLADAGAAVMLITHDIGLAINYCDRIAVFYAGTTVETALASDFSEESRLRHPYTKALWRAIPANGFKSTPGTQPYASSLPDGCLFAPRCKLCKDKCLHGTIAPRAVRDGEVCCHYAS
jgi:peptide/nickel transport system ATP-binding protein